MMGFIEWTSKEHDEKERANVTRCMAEQGDYRIEFANTTLLLEGRLSFSGGSAEQKTTGVYMYTDGSYSGEAEVIGRFTSSPHSLEFTGTWHDPEDGTGNWEVYVAIEDAPGQEYRFTYDEPEAKGS
jgi:hypothetical protein